MPSTKYQAENLIMHFYKVYKIPSVSLRFFNTYGPRSRTSGAYGAVFGVFCHKNYTVNHLL